MEHVFKIDLFPLILLADQSFLEMSQFGLTSSGAVRHDRMRSRQAVKSQDLDCVM